MKKYMLLSFFLSINLHSAHHEKNIFSLPNELIYYIFNLISYKSGYKNMIISKGWYEYIYNYLLYEQGILLSKSNISEKEKNKIILNNRFLLGYLRNKKNGFDHNENYLKQWTHGKLKYIFTEDSDTLFYVPNKESIKNLYKICIIKAKCPTLHNTEIGFLEGPYSPIFRKNLIQSPLHFYQLNIGTLVIKFSDPLSNDPTFFNNHFQNGLRQAQSVKLLFSHPTSLLSIPDTFNKLHIKGPIQEIYFNFLTSHNNLQAAADKKSSLSLQLLIYQDTNTHCFKDLEQLTHLKKLTLHFDKNSEQNNNFHITCPANLKTLKILNCFMPIFIPSRLNSLKIVSPKKGCKIKFSPPPKGTVPALNNLPLIGPFFPPALDSLDIENDQNDYFKNILLELKIPQLPKKLMIKNCSYKTLVPHQYPLNEKN